MRKYWWVLGIALALVVAILSPLASSHPDVVERVAEDHRFIEKAREPWYQVIPDYLLPGVQSEGLATILAGVVGTLLMFAILFGLGRLIRKGSAAGS